MPTPYRQDVLLAPVSVLAAGGIDALNTILDGAGLGRPLRDPGPVGDGVSLVALPLTDADPLVVRDALRRAAANHDLPDLIPDMQYVATTDEDGAQPRELVANDGDLFAVGKKTGHGTAAWAPVSVDEMAPAPDWQPVTQRPVVAVLDSGVRAHSWLPLPIDRQEFCIEAVGWQPPLDIPTLTPNRTGADFGSHRGHATFIAGLIRLAAPDAQVLSVRVMGDAGTVSEVNVIAALRWLAEYVDDGNALDVALMAFGRPEEPDDESSLGQIGDLKVAIGALAGRGVTIVASAGNGGSADPVIPAAFADNAYTPLVSVGAGDATGPAPFSSFGPWVKQWRPGTDIISIMPLRPVPAPDGNGYACWSGTSFAAATYAGELANSRKSVQTRNRVGP